MPQENKIICEVDNSMRKNSELTNEECSNMDIEKIGNCTIEANAQIKGKYSFKYMDYYKLADIQIFQRLLVKMATLLQS